MGRKGRGTPLDAFILFREFGRIIGRFIITLLKQQEL